MPCNVCVFIRYNVDPDEVEESKEYARSWIALIGEYSRLQGGDGRVQRDQMLRADILRSDVRIALLNSFCWITVSSEGAIVLDWHSTTTHIGRVVEALIVVDMQVGLLDGAPKYGLPKVIGRINSLSAKLRNDGGAVVWIRHCGKPGEGFERGTPGWEFFRIWSTTPATP